jgi:hypothetical protein
MIGAISTHGRGTKLIKEIRSEDMKRPLGRRKFTCDNIKTELKKEVEKV